MDQFSDDPRYRAIRHLTSVLDLQVIAAEELQRGRDPEGKARLGILSRMQAVLSREAGKITDPDTSID